MLIEGRADQIRQKPPVSAAAMLTFYTTHPTKDTMNDEQFEALIQYIRAVASREAVLAACGSDEGGYDRAERACEAILRRLLVDRPTQPTTDPA